MTGRPPVPAGRQAHTTPASPTTLGTSSSAQPTAAAAPAAAPAAPAAPPVPSGPPGALTLIGAGHVLAIHEAIRDAIHALRPDVVFVELDEGRLRALVAREQGQTPPPAASRVQRSLARFQERIAASYGAQVGEEMLAAVRAGQEVGARIALVDAPAQDTLAKAAREITWRERARAVGDFAGAGVRALFNREQSNVEAELKRYQDDPAGVLEELRQRYPTVHRILIADRDKLMAQRIRYLLAGARHGVAVLGDGHIEGMAALLADLHPKLYRLADAREGRLPRPAGKFATGTPERVSFSFDQPV